MNFQIDSSIIGSIKVKILRYIVYAVMAITVILMILIPQYIKAFSVHFLGFASFALSTSVVVYVYLCCIPFLTALYMVKKICDLILNNNPFSVYTLHCLSLIVLCCYIEAGINLLAIILFPIFLDYQIYALGFLIIGICGSVAVFATVLKELLKSAMRLREENELTI